MWSAQSRAIHGETESFGGDLQEVNNERILNKREREKKRESRDSAFVSPASRSLSSTSPFGSILTCSCSASHLGIPSWALLRGLQVPWRPLGHFCYRRLLPICSLTHSPPSSISTSLHRHFLVAFFQRAPYGSSHSFFDPIAVLADKALWPV